MPVTAQLRYIMAVGFDAATGPWRARLPVDGQASR
jgi:hypothetical protein